MHYKRIRVQCGTQPVIKDPLGRYQSSPIQPLGLDYRNHTVFGMERRVSQLESSQGWSPYIRCYFDEEHSEHVLMVHVLHVHHSDSQTYNACAGAYRACKWLSISSQGANKRVCGTVSQRHHRMHTYGMEWRQGERSWIPNHPPAP